MQHMVRMYTLSSSTLVAVLVTPQIRDQRLLRRKQLTSSYKCQRSSRQDQIPALHRAQPGPLWHRLPRGCRPYRNV